MRKVVMVLMVAGLVLLTFSATATAKPKAMPFRGYVVGQVWFTPGTPEDPSPSVTGLWTDSSACGDVSHLGATVMTGRHPTPAGTDITGGKMAMVASNGDEVWIAYTGDAPYPIPGVPSTILVDVDFTITGGTGRFASASGGGEMTAYAEFPGVLDPGPWPAHWVWKATIKY